MARKQQRNLANAARVLDEIKAQRLALQAKIKEIEVEVEALHRKQEALQDEEVIKQTRRKLRYPVV